MTNKPSWGGFFQEMADFVKATGTALANDLAEFAEPTPKSTPVKTTPPPGYVGRKNNPVPPVPAEDFISPQEKPKDEATEEAMYRGLLQDRIRKAALVLRLAAEAMEKDADDLDNLDTRPNTRGARSYSSVVSAVQQSVITAVANTRLGQLTEASMVADVARYTRLLRAGD